MTDLLKPCPFCGADAKPAGAGSVECSVPCMGAWHFIDEWNRRAMPPEVRKVVEEMKACYCTKREKDWIDALEAAYK